MTATRRARGNAGLAFAALLAFMAVVYANPGNWFDAMPDLGFAKMAAGLSLAALAGSWLLYGRPLTVGGILGWPLVGLFILVGLSPLWSFWPKMSTTTFFDGLKYLAIFFVVANVVDSPHRLRRFVAALAWVTVIPAVGAIWSYFHGELLVEGDRATWIGIFGNPNDLAYHLVVGVAMVLAAREGARRRALKLIYLALLIPIGWAIVLTESRGGLLASGAVLLFWAIRSLKHAPALVGVALALICVCYLSPGNVWSERMQSAQAHGEDLSAQGRIDAWRTGLNIVAERPWTGVGAGAFVVAYPTFAPGDAGPARTEHNTFVQLVSELGIPALAFFLLAFGASVLGVSRAAHDPALSPYARGIQAGLAGFAVCSLTGGIAFSWPLYLLFGAAAATHRMTPAARRARVPAFAMARGAA